MVGVEYFGPSDGFDDHEFSIYLLFFRVTAKWK